jgi:lipoic acid synthetase
MELEYAVVTSVTRDDLPDGGAVFFAETIRQIRSRSPKTRVEVLIPDFQGSFSALKTLVNAAPDVINHNIETVPGLYARVRPQAEYPRSLELFSNARKLNPTIPLKSGLMLGLGETREEVITTLKDLFDHGCRILTMGQYLQPTKAHLPVARFLTPDEFEGLRRTAQQIGFEEIASGPFVRSSYNAQSLFLAACP